MKLTLPTWLTLLRILMIPLLVLVFYLPFGWTNFASAAVFGFAAITDWLDGWIARRYHQSSAFGAFLDPVADKLMVAGALVVLLQLDRVEPLVALIIIGREIAMSALREWMAQMGQGKSVAVAFIGKLKTEFQMIAIPMLLFHDALFGFFNCQFVGTILINVAAVLTVISMLYYLRKAGVNADGTV